MIAVDKPAGQLVHPIKQLEDGDLVTMKLLRDQIGQQVTPAHRLDRPTSGVLLFSLAQEVAHPLHKAFKNREVEKTYWAVVDGLPDEEYWTCREPIRNDDDSPHRSAETDFRVLTPLGNALALVEARPRTGRYHQIRRHLLHAGFPIVGDYRYAGIERSDELGAALGTGTRMLLQAKSLRFIHPVTREEVLIDAPVDPLIRQVCDGSHLL